MTKIHPDRLAKALGAAWAVDETISDSAIKKALAAADDWVSAHPGPAFDAAVDTAARAAMRVYMKRIDPTTSRPNWQTFAASLDEAVEKERNDADAVEEVRDALRAAVPLLAPQPAPRVLDAATLKQAASLAPAVCEKLFANGPVCPCGNGRVPTGAYRAATDAYARAIAEMVTNAPAAPVAPLPIAVLLADARVAGLAEAARVFANVGAQLDDRVYGPSVIIERFRRYAGSLKVGDFRGIYAALAAFDAPAAPAAEPPNEPPIPSADPVLAKLDAAAAACEAAAKEWDDPDCSEHPLVPLLGAHAAVFHALAYERRVRT